MEKILLTALVNAKKPLKIPSESLALYLQELEKRGFVTINKNKAAITDSGIEYLFSL